jgi:Copper binding periplasmic protein CusF
MREVRSLALTLGLTFAALSCKGTADVNAHYTVRGQVQRLDGSGSDARALIHHERIPEFKDRDGKPSAMDSMSMNFSLGPGVSADLLKPGAKVSIEFDVRWSSGDPLVITNVTPLPDDTQLTLSDHH